MTQTNTHQAVLSPIETLLYVQRVEELLSAPRINHKTGEITHPNSWVQNREAITYDGQGCDPKSDLAVAYCMIGAVAAVTQSIPEYQYVLSIINAANPVVVSHASGKNGGVPSVNDHLQSFTQVIHMLQKTQKFITTHLI